MSVNGTQQSGKMAAMTRVHHREPHAHGDVDQQEAAILALLRAGGGRVTTGRRAVVRALLTGPDHHVTADDIAAAVQAEHPDVHLSTIYRTLESLEEHGVVERVSLGAGAAIFHLTDHAHHHLVCTVCGSVIEVPSGLLRTLARQVDQRYGFELPRQHVALAGRCADCRDR